MQCLWSEVFKSFEVDLKCNCRFRFFWTRKYKKGRRLWPSPSQELRPQDWSNFFRFHVFFKKFFNKYMIGAHYWKSLIRLCLPVDNVQFSLLRPVCVEYLMTKVPLLYSEPLGCPHAEQMSMSVGDTHCHQVQGRRFSPTALTCIQSYSVSWIPPLSHLRQRTVENW